MTFDQKVEKLRSIINKEIAIWCKEEEQAIELKLLFNEVTGKNYFDDFWYVYGNGTSYILEGNKWEYDSVNYYERLGYKVITYLDFFEENVKPLEDWTLKEIKNYCDEISCSDCKFYELYMEDAEEKEELGCLFRMNRPWAWDLSEKEDKLVLTESEIEILKAVVTLYAGCDIIFCNKGKDRFTNSEECGLVQIPSRRLPSLKADGTKYSIRKLLGEE